MCIIMAIKGGKIMSKDKNVELTSELYSKISADKSSKIIKLRDEKNETIKNIEEEMEILTQLLE